LDRFVGQFSLGPMGDRAGEVLGRLAGEGHDLTVGFGAYGRRRSRAGSIGQTLGGGHFGRRNFLPTLPAVSPMAHHVPADAQFAGNGLVVVPLLRQENNLGTQSDLLGRRMTPDEGL
jgi:hypothetical protein